MTKITKVNKGWQYFTLPNINIFNKSEFNKAFDTFWSSVMRNIPNSQVIGVLIKVKDTNGSYITLGPLCKINRKSDRANLRTTLFHYVGNKGNRYSSFTVSSIIFQYIYINSTTEIPEIEENKVNDYSSGDYNYPLSTDLSNWGTVVNKRDNKTTLINEKYEGIQIVVSTFSEKQVYEICVQPTGRKSYSNNNRFPR